MKKKITLLLGCMWIFTFLFVITGKDTIANAEIYNYDEVLVGTKNLNNTLNNSAEVEKQLFEPEKGWKRYDDKNSKIKTDFASRRSISGVTAGEKFYMGNFSSSEEAGKEFKFSFKGQKFRIIGPRNDTSMGRNHTEVFADGVKVKTMSFSGYPGAQFITYEYSFNKAGNHNVMIRHMDPPEGRNPRAYSSQIDAIDVDGELIDFNSVQGLEPAIEYQAYVQDLGWAPWVNSDSITGTTGQGKRIEAVRIRLKAPYVSDNNLRVQYRAHVQDLGWLPWVENGDIAGTTEQARQMEAIQIRIVDNNGVPRSDYELYYSAHVKDKGWLPEVPTNGIAGTIGEKLQMEALRIRSFKK